MKYQEFVDMVRSSGAIEIRENLRTRSIKVLFTNEEDMNRIYGILNIRKRERCDKEGDFLYSYGSYGTYLGEEDTRGYPWIFMHKIR